MAKPFSITVYPSDLGADYLSVSDALHHVLDLVEALEKSESQKPNGRSIVWRLTEAHTNSPPLTIVVEPFPINPSVSVTIEANRVTAAFSTGLGELLNGRQTPWLDRAVAEPLKRIFSRNTKGIGRTSIDVGETHYEILPANAPLALQAIERAAAGDDFVENQQHTEYGAVEVIVGSITRWNGKPALVGTERLSEQAVTCVLSPELADRIGPRHRWNDAWGGERILVTGALHYDKSGMLKRIDAEDVEDLPWTDVSLADLAELDILQGRTVQEHIDLIRGRDIG